MSGNKTFSLVVYQKPKFASNLENQIDLISNKLGKYSLPVVEGISDETVTHTVDLPNFVSFSFPNY